MAKDSEISTAKTTAQLANVPGRHFASLSVHPNSEEILFLEFKPDELQSVSRLLRYHLKTGDLRYYDLPTDYVYLDASFSPSGKYIVMRRAPNIKGNEDARRQAYASSEIAMMNSDGTDLKVIPLKAGLKMAPVMSHDDKYIAYWRATQRPDGSKSFAAGFDVWEVDLRTGKEQPFAGIYEFFSGGQINYLKGNARLLVDGDMPASNDLPGRTQGNFGKWLDEYNVKNNRSYTYVLNRGNRSLPDPLFTNINAPSFTSLDQDGNIYFKGYKPGGGFIKTKSFGNASDFVKWDYPWKSMGVVSMANVLPNGSAMIFLFLYLDSPHRDRTNLGIGMLNFKNEKWTQLEIPSLKVASIFSKSKNAQ